MQITGGICSLAGQYVTVQLIVLADSGCRVHTRSHSTQTTYIRLGGGTPRKSWGLEQTVALRIISGSCNASGVAAIYPAVCKVCSIGRLPLVGLVGK